MLKFGGCHPIVSLFQSFKEPRITPGSVALSSATSARMGASSGASSCTRSRPQISALPVSPRYLADSRSRTQCLTGDRKTDAGRGCEAGRRWGGGGGAGGKTMHACLRPSRQHPPA